jgi:hypothetical protein
MPGLLRGVARTAVIAGTATAVSNRVSRRQAGRWADQEQAEASRQQTYAQPAYAGSDGPGDGMDERIAALKELAALRDQGVLDEAEFAAQKRRILGS